MELEDYPSVIKDISDELVSSRIQLRNAQNEIKYRKAYMLRMKLTPADGTNAEQRNASMILKLTEDKDYIALVNQEDELTSKIASLEAEYTYRRDQFAVMKLQLQEKIAAAS
jgi:hypothetical protein